MSDPRERPVPKPPKTKARLEQLITQWQKDSGKPVSLLNLRIAAMMLSGALARVTDPDGDGIFAIKGGVAMELRMGDRARATRDVDLIMRGDPTQLAALLDDGLRDPYAGFSFRRDALGDLPSRPQVKKTRVQVSFARRSLTTLLLEIAVVLVLAERWQIAQKLHAVTEQFADGRENPRFRDLIDLQLLEALDPDIAAVRDACERVFAVRDQHEWPPALVVQPAWLAEYRALAEGLAFPVEDVADAVRVVQDFIDRIAGS